MPTIGSLLWLVMWQPCAEVTVPVLGRPADFSGLVGHKLTLETRINRTECPLDEFILFTLTVRNLLNADDAPRPDLAQHPDFRPRFQIEDDLTPLPEGDGTRQFRYRLRPLQRDLTLIPALELRYYDPNIPQPPDRPSLPFVKARAAPLPIKVVERVPPPRVIVSLDVPAFAAQEASASLVLSPNVWYGSALAVPLLVVGTGALWATFHPSSWRAARRRRSRSTRRCLKRLRSLTTHDDPAQLGRLLAYELGTRFGLSNVPQTPTEWQHALATFDVPTGWLSAVVRFFSQLDAMRFASDRIGNIPDHAATACSLIEALEAHE